MTITVTRGSVRPPDGRAFFGDEDEYETLRTSIGAFVGRAVAAAGADGVVVGVSGGIDSMLTAALAAEALGSDRVLALTLPSRKGHRPDANDARTIAEGLGIEFREVPLWPLVDEFVAALDAVVDGDVSSRVRGNLVARLRMACLYYVANVESRLVLGTTNRSELLTGYVTKHGDAAADLYPLGGLYKTEVRALAQHVGLPRRIVVKTSTAGFWSGQTDADDLGATYDVVDRLFARVLDDGRDVGAVVAELGLDPQVAADLLERYVETEHKRTATPTLEFAGRRSARRRCPARVRERVEG